jgi:Site-specific recombinase XerD
MEATIYNILNDMSEILSISQMKKLQEVLITRLESEQSFELEAADNQSYLEMFITAKRIEGCSERTLQYYKSTIESLLGDVEVPVRKMTTELLREYLANYQNKNGCGKVTIDNVRRNLSSFFSWLEEESHILKNPIRRIHKIRTKTSVKEVISDESMETIRDHCVEPRDLAIIDLLASTGMRVGELVNLDICDLNFDERECIVFGKGDKERKVYFDARTKIHLKNYLDSRNDNNPAVFVSLNDPHKRLQISGVEIRVRKLGRELNLDKIHPHKFRRTMATRAIDKGMPIEQVQKLLGHQQIDTTMKYAMVNQSNVKASHRKYIS